MALPLPRLGKEKDSNGYATHVIYGACITVGPWAALAMVGAGTKAQVLAVTAGVAVAAALAAWKEWVHDARGGGVVSREDFWFTLAGASMAWLAVAWRIGL